MNSYKGYIWDFFDYLVEYKRRENIQELWQVYIAQCLSVGIKGMPKYLELLNSVKENKILEDPEKVKQRLIDKINKSNRG